MTVIEDTTVLVWVAVVPPCEIICVTVEVTTEGDTRTTVVLGPGDDAVVEGETGLEEAEVTLLVTVAVGSVVVIVVVP